MGRSAGSPLAACAGRAAGRASPSPARGRTLAGAAAEGGRKSRPPPGMKTASRGAAGAPGASPLTAVEHEGPSCAGRIGPATRLTSTRPGDAAGSRAGPHHGEASAPPWSSQRSSRGSTSGRHAAVRRRRPLTRVGIRVRLPGLPEPEGAGPVRAAIPRGDVKKRTGADEAVITARRAVERGTSGHYRRRRLRFSRALPRGGAPRDRKNSGMRARAADPVTVTLMRIARSQGHFQLHLRRHTCSREKA
jgi:hypothetical protein